jgi:uncharacterized protein (DUF433 family)
MSIDDHTLIGIGLYTTSDASRLTGIPSGKLVRWLKGHGKRNRRYEPLWQQQVRLDDETVYLGFLDLVQARLASSFIKEGLSPQKVRRAIAFAKEMIQTEHPFATSRFRTDGKTLMLEVMNADEDGRLVDLFKNGQYLLKKIIEPSLKGIEFEADFAARWWPSGRSSGVVVDPTRQFGQPIMDSVGIPTRVLSLAVVSEGSITAAARAYCVTEATVRAAHDFEHRKAA